MLTRLPYVSIYYSIAYHSISYIIICYMFAAPARCVRGLLSQAAPIAPIYWIAASDHQRLTPVTVTAWPLPDSPRDQAAPDVQLPCTCHFPPPPSPQTQRKRQPQQKTNPLLPDWTFKSYKCQKQTSGRKLQVSKADRKLRSRRPWGERVASSQASNVPARREGGDLRFMASTYTYVYMYMYMYVYIYIYV